MVAAKTEAFDLQRKLDMATGGRGAAVSYNGNGDSKSGLPLFTSSKAKDEGKSKASSAFSSSSSSSSKFASAAGSKSSTAGFANGAVSAGGLSSGKAVRITFSLQQELPFGQSLKLVGSHPALGAWKEDMGPVMQWTQGHKWQCSVTLPAGSALEFKVRGRRWGCGSSRPARRRRRCRRQGRGSEPGLALPHAACTARAHPPCPSHPPTPLSTRRPSR